MKRIDFEAHFYTQAYLKALIENRGYPRLTEASKDMSRRLWHAEEVGQPYSDALLNLLLDLGEARVKRMDSDSLAEAGEPA